MNRLLIACLAMLVLAHAACAFPNQLEYLLGEETDEVSKRYADEEALYRVQRSQASCSINCIDCGRRWMKSFNTDSCMKHCKSVKASESSKYSSCRRFYISRN